MIRKPFFIFITIITGLILSLLWFTQTPQFADILKSGLSRYLPKNAGVVGDFSAISIKFFPPGFSLMNPKIRLEEQNLLRLPAGSKVEAERIDFGFLPFQMLSGDIRVHNIGIVNGRVSLILNSSQMKKKPAQPKGKLEFHWDELFQIKAEGITAQNVQFDLEFRDSGESASCHIDHLGFAQWSGKGGLGYSFDLNLLNIQGSYLKNLMKTQAGTSIEKIEGKLFINALGVQADSFAVSVPGGSVYASGQVKGNVLDPKTLLADGKVFVEGDLSRLRPWLPIPSGKKDVASGQVRFRGAMTGNLLKPMETLKASGSLTINQGSFMNWNADLIQAHGSWEASPSGGRLIANRISISSENQNRIVNKQVIFGGGLVELGKFEWLVGSPSPLTIPLRFENAHVHWLGGGVLKEIYPLNFRLNGNVIAKIFPPEKGKAWEVQLQLATALEKFQLTNQRLGVIRPLHPIFNVPRLELKGGIHLDPVGVHPSNLILALPHTKLRIGGKIGFKTGFDLFASGPGNLEDLGEIAETEIRGQGTLAVQVKGPPERVLIDADLDMKDAKYLKLNLGSFKGRITWDDGPGYLIFRKPQLARGSTHYELSGYLDLGKHDDAYLDVKVTKGNIHEFIEIFDHLVSDLSWFPHTLTGPVAGRMKILGGLSLNQIQILAELNGTNWELFGERFKTVYLLGGYDRGKYYVEDFHSLKRFGRLTGKISYDANRKFMWGLKTENFNLVDLDLFTGLNVPMKGALNLQTVGEGIGSEIKSSSRVDLTDFKVRGVSMSPSSFEMETANGVIKAESSIMGRQGVVEVSYDLDPKKESSFHGQLNLLDFSPVLMLFNSQAIQDQKLAGYVSGVLNLNFHAGQVEKANGDLEISEYILSRSDARFSLVHPVESKIVDGTFNLFDLVVAGREGEAGLDLRSQGGELAGLIHGQLDTTLAEFFTSSISQATGVAHLDLAVGGSLKKPTLDGKVQLDGASVRISSLDSQLENIQGNFLLKDSVLSFKDFQGDLGDGKVAAAGQISLYSDHYPELDLKVAVTGSKVRVYPFQYAKINADIGVHGQSPPYLVDGNIRVLSALSKEKFLNSKQRGSEVKTLQYTPPVGSQGEGGASKFKLNVAVDAQKGIWIQNDLFRDVEARGNLTLVNTLESPGIVGTAEVIQGKLIFKDHVFQIISAGTKFEDPNSFNPSFNLNAVTEINGTKIQMYASGKPDKMKVEFSSTPSMPESEILSLLAVGITSNDAKKLSAGDLNVLQQGEAASLVLHSLDFNRDFEDKTGFQVQLDQSVNPQQGVSAFRPQGQSDAAAAPQITIRRRLTDRLSLSAGSTVGVGTSKSNQVNLDFLMNKDISISGVFNNYGSYGSNETQQTTQTQYSLGLDLKFQKRFK